MKKLSLLLCMSLLASSLVGCAKVNQLLDSYRSEKAEEAAETEKKEEVVEKDTTENQPVQQVAKDTNVYEVTIEELLNNGSGYEGKHVRVCGTIPADKVADTSGKEVFGVIADDGVNYIEITGKEPTIHNCKAWVMGIARTVEGEIVIEGTDFALIEQYGEQAPAANQQAVQAQQAPQEQLYYYTVVNGQRVFETSEGQQIWDARQPEQNTTPAPEEAPVVSEEQ